MAVATRPEGLVPFDYELPPGLIAQEPARERGDSRLMLLRRRSDTAAARAGGAAVDPADALVRDLPGLLRSGDLLVVNRSRVIAARLRCQRLPGGGSSEILLVAPCENRIGEERVLWRALGRPAKRLEPGRRLRAGDLELEIVARDGAWLEVAFPPGLDVIAALESRGEVPLPPYIRRATGTTDADRIRYQTVFAREPGSVAAPTAGLHLSEALLEVLRSSGVGVAEIVLHVGPATFLSGLPGRSPVLPEPERYLIPPATRAAISATRAAGGRVVAVGTTTTRALEAAAHAGWPSDWATTALVIAAGHEFQVVQGLLTNFHLPGTSLLALVAAFAGNETARRAYEIAVERRYRFYSYGDAMLIL